MTTTGTFTCSVSDGVICFNGVFCVTNSAGSLASSGLPCSAVFGRLSVALLILAACFPWVSRRFIPVEIKDQFNATPQINQVLKRQTSCHISSINYERDDGKEVLFSSTFLSLFCPFFIFSARCFLFSAEVYSLCFGVSVKIFVPLIIKSVMPRTARHIMSD